MQPRNISLLGASGSIGGSTLSVVRAYPGRFKVVGMVGGDNIESLSKLTREFNPQIVAVRTKEGAENLKKRLGGTPSIEILFGPEGAEKVAATPDADIVISGIVGAAGLRPTLAAVRAGKTIALANKESMVVAGALVSEEAKKHGAKLLPVDSEHSAIFQALGSAPMSTVRRLLLTASGGPFFPRKDMNLANVTREEALAHPNWKMGDKITIDSATMMNKGLEIIEARWLFDIPADRIDVVVHPQSIIHSMVEFLDGSVIAQLGVPDMKAPIAYALSYPDRLPEVVPSLNFAKLREMTFFDPDPTRFPSTELAREALSLGETYPAVLNGSNEVTVRAFLDERIGFMDIPRINGRVMRSFRQMAASDVEDFLAADSWGRTQAERAVSE